MSRTARSKDWRGSSDEGFPTPRSPTGVVNMAKGTLNAAMVCPHCTVRGKVFIRQVKRKAGLSGGKVVAGLLTMGVSVITPGIGLSRKENMTEAFCDNCRSVWSF